VAGVDASGNVLADGTGTAVITATSESRSSTMSLAVIPRIASAVLTSASAFVEVGSTLQFTLALFDAQNHPISAAVPTTWAISDPSRATLSTSGLLTGTLAGSVSVTATYVTGSFPSQSSTAAVSVTPHVPIISIAILPTPVGLFPGQTRTLAAFARDSIGGTILGPTFLWSSSAPSVASVVSASGVVTAAAAGAATVTAATGTQTGTAPITVFAPTTGAGIGTGFGLEQFALVQPGTFVMGTPDGNLDEKPVRTITLTAAFRMQKTEVTQSQWLSMMPSLPAGVAACATCPVTNVTWDQAQTFITQLNAANPGAGFRLPTEAQWEYAAHGGTTGATYGALDLIANYFITSDIHVWPVALKQANAFGLYDMIGNASEWTLDFYATSYIAAQTVDPTGPAAGTRHVDRGGSYTSVAFLARSTYRTGVSAEQIGFRLVRN
jgi:formylglycine-generating enzyme required for sulfatase activity